MDLLDLCVISEAETDPDKERVIGKLMEFVRICIQDEQKRYSVTLCDKPSDLDPPQVRKAPDTRSLLSRSPFLRGSPTE